jgi:hypothetical protein
VILKKKINALYEMQNAFSFASSWLTTRKQDPYRYNDLLKNYKKSDIDDRINWRRNDSDENPYVNAGGMKATKKYLTKNNIGEKKTLIRSSKVNNMH